MSKHDHPAPKPPCIHEGTLKFCAPCNAVECSACGFEWKAPDAMAAYKQWAWAPCTRPHRDEPLRPWFSDQWSSGQWSEPKRATVDLTATGLRDLETARRDDPEGLNRWLEMMPAGAQPELFPSYFPKHNH